MQHFAISTDNQILTQRPDRAVLALAELCREREDGLERAPRSNSPGPRAMSQPRGGFTTPGGNAAWQRSHSQVPFDRLSTPAFEGGRRGRQSEGNTTDNSAEVSAQDLWLASQGNNLGNIGSLGLGFPEGFDAGRGRDTSARGLETPGNYASRRGPSHFDHETPSGTMSAPLSPHRLYAQLEMGKGPASGWPAYESRQNAPAGSSAAPGGPSAFAGPSTGGVGNNKNRSTPSAKNAPGSGAPTPRSGSVNGSHTSKAQEAAATMPVFQPFSPPLLHSKLRHMNAAEANSASFISPSTLLSPQPAAATLPPSSVDSLVNDFDKMGVAPPGKGSENDRKGKAKTPGWQSGPVSKPTSPNPSRRAS